MKLFIALIASLFLVSACSTQQDPLNGAGDTITEGSPPDTNKPIAEKPLDKMNLQIDAPSLVNAEVGSEVHFKIAGRVMVPGVKFNLFVDNLADFPGATFDEATGEFSWTPTKAAIGNRVAMDLTLSVTIATIVAPGHASTSENKLISMILVNTFEKPTIQSVQGLDVISGGAAYTYKFKVKDRDATTKDDISIVPQPCVKSPTRTLTPYVKYSDYNVTAVGNNEYEGEVTIDVSTATKLMPALYCVGFAAVTTHGKISDVYEKSVYYEPKAVDSVSTLSNSNQITLIVGEVQRLSFNIYDPTGYGVMRVLKVDDIAKTMPGSTLKCAVEILNSSVITCEGLLDARTASPGLVRANIEVSTILVRSAQEAKTTHTLKLNVKAAPL